MPDDHPPLTAVAAALHEAIGGDEYCVCRDECQPYAANALRALDTDPVREWAQNLKCPKSPGGAFACAGNSMVHPECLLAALAPPEAK